MYVSPVPGRGTLEEGPFPALHLTEFTGLEQRPQDLRFEFVLGTLEALQAVSSHPVEEGARIRLELGMNLSFTLFHTLFCSSIL